MIGLLMDTDGDMKVSNGEMAIGNTTYQNQFVILKVQRGELKEFPMLGIGIDDIVNDHDIAGWKMKIKEHLAMDGISVSKVDINTSTGELTLVAE